MKLEKFIKYRLSKRNFIHDFSLGALFAYHELEKLVDKEKAHLTRQYAYLRGKSDYLIMYEQMDELMLRGMIEEADKDIKVASNTPIHFLERMKRVKQKEVFYQLDKLSSHLGKKKYHSYSKPVKIVENRPDLGIRIESMVSDSAGQASLKALHDEWVQHKLSQPKVHRISFPTARYRRTLEQFPFPTYKREIWIKNKLYGFIVFSIENGVAFELSFCTLYWKPEFKILSGLNQYLFSYFLIQLQKEGVQFVNSGYELNKNLRIFKQSAQTSTSVFRWQYGT